MGDKTFKQDLLLGQQFETVFCEILVRHGYLILSMCNDKRFDIEAVKDTLITTFEVKADMMSTKTGNFFIEFVSYGKPSGISATEADYWVLYHINQFIIIKTIHLKKLIEEKKYDRILSNRHMTTRGYLFKCQTIIQARTGVPEITTDEVETMLQQSSHIIDVSDGTA